MHYYRHPATLSALLIGGALSFSSVAHASGFALHEQNAALLGGFYAGSAAIAEDASTNWYNPAGLTRLNKGGNVAVSGVNVSTQSEFTGTTTLTQGPFELSETGEATGGTARLIPAFHAAYRINDQFAVGFSAVSPFGLSTNYSEDSIARYNATESEIKSIDFTPSVAYQPLEWLSFGVGFDAEYTEAKIDGVLGCVITSMCGSDQTASDSISKNKANDWGYGWHGGVLAVVPQTGTHLGLAFHSSIEQNLSGRSKLHGPLNPTGAVSDVSGTAELPWWLVGSLSHEFNDIFSVLGSIEYYHWSSITKLELDGVQTGDGDTATSTDDLNYENTWGFFGALRYNMLSNLMWSVGLGYEQTPTNDTDRDLRLPDSNRWIGSIGLRYVPEVADKVQLDIGYAHLWGQEVDVNKTIESDTQTTTAVGHNNAQANIVGAQITVKI